MYSLEHAQKLGCLTTASSDLALCRSLDTTTLAHLRVRGCIPESLGFAATAIYTKSLVRAGCSPLRIPLWSHTPEETFQIWGYFDGCWESELRENKDRGRRPVEPNAECRNLESSGDASFKCDCYITCKRYMHVSRFARPRHSNARLNLALPVGFV